MKIRVLFICHGNICRSPMAEYIMKDMVEKRGLSDKFQIASAATSTEEIGNPVHPGTRKILSRLGISCAGKRARQLTRHDYSEYDYLIGMDEWNLKNMKRILGDDPDRKLSRLLDYTNHPRDIADPWYTGDFDATCQDILNGCQALLQHIKETHREEQLPYDQSSNDYEA